MYSLFPLHAGMRQYWRDFPFLKTGGGPYPINNGGRTSWRDSGGLGFWHETYFARGGMEAIYDDVNQSIGFAAFPLARPAQGPKFSARRRLGLRGEPTVAAPVKKKAF